MHIPARSDYAVPAMLAIADAAPILITAPELAARHRIPLGFLHGMPPALGDYTGAARPLRGGWLATEEAIRDVVDRVSLSDVLSGVPTRPAPQPAAVRGRASGP